MIKNVLQFEYSTWWIPIIALVAAGLSYFLYAKKNVPWSQNQNWLLFGIRSMGIFLIFLLLLDPYIKTTTTRVEKPLLALAIDNSESVISRGADSTSIKDKLNQLKEQLENDGFELIALNLSQSEKLNFNHKTTRLSQLMREIEEVPNQENLVASILVTDGIFNRGSSPLYRSYIHPVYSVGMGDTIPPKDISISRSRYNKVTFKGNETPIRLEINQKGYDATLSTVGLYENGKLLSEKKIQFNSSLQEVEFSLSSEEEGLRHLVAKTPVQPDESTGVNNETDIFLEVIDGRQKILILANAPHPDIVAIRRSLEETDNYDTDLYIPAIHEEHPTGIYDVIIRHGAFGEDIDYLPKEQPGVWYILNTESKLNLLNNTLTYINIEKRSSDPDQVGGIFNTQFTKFKIENNEVFESFPPLAVPFGDYTVSPTSEVLMFQKLGNTATSKPLMVLSDNRDMKSALLMGQDIWRWKLQEAATTEGTRHFDNLINKTIQFLSVKNDKKQFRFEARTSTFRTSEPILFDVEVYNEIYERIYGTNIDITLEDEDGGSITYQFADAENNTTFRAPSLLPGIYRYSARVQIGSDSFSEQGEFLVEEVNPEFLDLTADHRLLKNVSSKSGGEFIHFSQIENLPKRIEERQFKPIMRSNEDHLPLIKSAWYFLFILLLFSTEWVLRRYWGGY